MDNKEFDKHIKEKLEGVQPGRQTDWDDFSKLLAKDKEFEHISFDKGVSDKLKGQKTPYNSEHWILLQQRLEAEAHIRKDIWIKKIMEVSLVFLLLLSFFHIDKVYSPAQYHDIASSKERKLAAHIINYPQFEDIINKHPQLIKVSHKDLQTLTQLIRTNISDKSNTSFNEIYLSAEFLPISIIKLNELTHFQQKGTTNKELTTNHSSSNQEHYSDVEEKEYNSYTYLALHPLKEVKYEINNSYPMFYIPTPEDEVKNYNIIASSILNNNLIGSPADEKFRLPKHNFSDLNFGAEVLVSSQYKNMEVGVGIGLQHISYTPTRLTEIVGGLNSGITKYSLEHIDFTSASIPLHINYHFNPDSRIRFYAGGMFAVNAILFTNYEISKEVISPRPSNGFGPSPQAFVQNEPSILSQKDYHRGVFQSGSFHDNITLEAGIHVGMEYSIAANTAIRGQIGVNKMLNAQGLGPNNDIIDAIRFGLGIKYNI